MKKVDSNMFVIPETSGRVPEYVNMSRKPGIAHDWFQKYWHDVYPVDRVIFNDSVQIRPPRYFDKLLERIDETLMADLRHQRKATAIHALLNEYPKDRNAIILGFRPDRERLDVKEKVQKIKIQKLKRGYESEK